VIYSHVGKSVFEHRSIAVYRQKMMLSPHLLCSRFVCNDSTVNIKTYMLNSVVCYFEVDNTIL
jgi:hypothetical protein